MTMRNCSVDEILALLRNGHAIEDVEATEALDLTALCQPDPVLGFGHKVNDRIEFQRCRLHSLDAPGVQFLAPVILCDTRVEGVKTSPGSFWCSYFPAGAHLARCEFGGPLDFQCGGENLARCSFILRDSVFHEFVNFLDCMYRGPVEIRRCRFEKGSNLLGNKGQPFEASFDVPPVIEENEGRLDLDGG